MSAAAEKAEKAEQAFQKRMSAMADALAAEVVVKQAQIRCLRGIAARAYTAITAELLLTLYSTMPSAQKVAEFARTQGWQVPGAKGPRALTAVDVYALLRGEPSAIAPPADTVLLAIARERLKGRGGYTGLGAAGN